MLSPYDRIAVALSGGKDSAALLHILTKIEERFPRVELIAITIDEGIRGYRREAIRIARENCKKLGVEQSIFSFKKLYNHTLDELAKIAKEKLQLTPCSICGILRRKALNVAAKEVGATKLATAHNLDDESQTILINIIHGDIWKLARVEPMITRPFPGFITRIKPLCRIPESEVAFYAYLQRIKFQESSCPYMRDTLRSHVRLTLNRLEVRYPGTKFKIIRSIEKIRPLLKGLVEVELKYCKICGEPSIKGTCRACEILSKIEN
jgi:uncharacterized protein (TIGR00269 family)